MRLKNSRGFTTIEIVFVLALFSFITGGFVSNKKKLEKQVDQQQERIEECERLEDFLDDHGGVSK